MKISKLTQAPSISVHCAHHRQRSKVISSIENQSTFCGPRVVHESGTGSPPPPPPPLVADTEKAANQYTSGVENYDWSVKKRVKPLIYFQSF